MLLTYLTALQGQRFHFISNQKTRAFVKTDDRIIRIIRQRIQCQNGFHMRQRATIQLSQTPGAF